MKYTFFKRKRRVYEKKTRKFRVFKLCDRTYAGNYDTFCQTKEEQDEAQMKIYNKEQVDLQKMKDYVARFGHGSRKLAKQGKSKEKLMNKRIAEGMTEKVYREKTVSFRKSVFKILEHRCVSSQGSHL